MKRVLGLDLGTTSVGWAIVEEAENSNEKSGIIKSGVRIVSLSTDEVNDFKKGKAISINSDRTLKRGARRNLQRYKQRRKHLYEILEKNNLISNSFKLPEVGKLTTHNLWELRSKAAEEEIELNDFFRVLFALNKKRGYKSNRKAKDDGEGQAIDGMEIAKKMYNEDLTCGEIVLDRLKNNKKTIPEFYPSDLRKEFLKITNNQQAYYPEKITQDFKEEILGKSSKATYAICDKFFVLDGLIQKGNREEKKLELYEWRVKALNERIGLEELTLVLQQINTQLNSASGYLGDISDRAKELYFNNQTVGQYLFEQLNQNKHNKLKGQVFYRKDYLDEFERIWEIQSQNRKDILTDDLKEAIRDTIIFYQRRLKSQKGLISICELEGVEKEVKRDGKIRKIVVGPKVIPRSSPLFQEFKVWQKINDLEFISKEEKLKEKVKSIDKDLKIRSKIFDALMVNQKLSDKEIVKIADKDSKVWKTNFKNGIDGQLTNEKLFSAFRKICELSGHQLSEKDSYKEQIDSIKSIFQTIGIDSSIIDFDSSLGYDENAKKNLLQEQEYYKLWHLLYSYEEDIKHGMKPLYDTLNKKYGIPKEWAKPLVSLDFSDDYGSLSAKAISKILPFLKSGLSYSEAADASGYNHSNYQTTEERRANLTDDSLSLVPKNSLRNPVVEKILNQMVNVVNAIIEEYGKPDEIRVELARELKKSASEREEMTKAINSGKSTHEKLKKEITELYPFNKGIRITRNDLIKYKLWKELAFNSYRELYTNTRIPIEELFTNKYDIEHIIPKAKLFDDSFSNKTLATNHFNNKIKDNKTAWDAVSENCGGEDSQGFKDYLSRVESYLKDNPTKNKAKYKKLRMKEADIPDGFIERDLRNSQYIAKKSVEILRKICNDVWTTSGSVTSRLREDWQLINVLKDINFEKFKKRDLIEVQTNKHNQKIEIIKDWSKRNDHRHHAMDAINVAFTRPQFVQYYNFLNARENDGKKLHTEIIGIQNKYTNTHDRKRVINPPMPLAELRDEVKKQLESILISHKTKNKVVTKNKNQIKGQKKAQIVLTPRDQLHKETVYGKSRYYASKEEKISSKFDQQTIDKVANKKYRELLHKRLEEFGNDPKKAFGGKNTIQKNPIYLDSEEQEKLPDKVKLVWLENQFTIRKEVNPTNFKTTKNIDKVIDSGARKILLDRLQQYEGDAKKAFSNLEEYPIWMNEEKGLQLKRVKISGVSNAEPLHYKKDLFGKDVLDDEGNPIPVDYVSTGNNHHIAIYEDKDGNLQDFACSFSDAVKRTTYNLPVVPKNTDELWDKVLNLEIKDISFIENLPKPGLNLLYSMKQNECFVFPNSETDFEPQKVDLLNKTFASAISPNLFRVQKLSKVEYGNSSVRDYVFRHHLETEVADIKELKGVTFKSIKSLQHLIGIQKVRLNHLGKIVQVGEY